jgi:hypothetical protein
VRTYDIVDENAKDRLMIFRNSLATYETIRMTGNLDKTNRFTREVSNMIFPQEFIDTFRQKISRITDTEERLTINTGYTDNIQITNWWMELISSDDVYYWDGTRLISAIITNEEVLQYSDEEPVYNLALELMLSNASAGSVGLQGNYYSSLVNNTGTVDDEDVLMDARSKLTFLNLKENLDLVNQFMETGGSKIKRSETVGNICYCGTAPSGTAESATTWTLTKIVVATNGTTTVTHATNSWTNNLTANYQ